MNIYNACWKLWYFPDIWKRDNLVILLKDVAERFDNVKNYRPIFLLPVYGKVLEKIIKNKNMQHLSPLHSGSQYGFIPGSSTSDALLRYKNTNMNSTANYITSIFVDIQGTFVNEW